MTWKNTRRRRKPVRWPYFERCEYACLYFLSICLSTDFILSILCIVFIAKSFIIFKIQSKGHESPLNSKAVSGTPVAKHPKCGRLTWQRLACHTLTVAMHVLLTEITQPQVASRLLAWRRKCHYGTIGEYHWCVYPWHPVSTCQTQSAFTSKLVSSLADVGNRWATPSSGGSLYPSL